MKKITLLAASALLLLTACGQVESTPNGDHPATDDRGTGGCPAAASDT